jgi:hypothetical protein
LILLSSKLQSGQMILGLLCRTHSKTPGRCDGAARLLEEGLAYLKSDQIEMVLAELEKIQPKYNEMLFAFSHHKYESSAAAEYAQHGFLRRLGSIPPP